MLDDFATRPSRFSILRPCRSSLDSYLGEVSNPGALSKSKPSRLHQDSEKLLKSLLSIGVDKNSAERLVSSRDLGNAVVPIYWKDGIVSKVNSFWLQTLTEFLRSFALEFPDGQIRWDPHYRGERPEDGDMAVRVIFYYQEDDQGDHWSPRPDTLEEESYYRMLKRFTYKGDTPVSASRIIHGR